MVQVSHGCESTENQARRGRHEVPFPPGSAPKPQAGGPAAAWWALSAARGLLACAIIVRADAQYDNGGQSMTDQELEQEIERTREHLGNTIDELAGKADMKARARARAAEVKARAQDRAADVSGRVRQSKAAQSKAVQSQVLRRRWPVAVAAGVIIAGSVIIRRRRRGRA
jgi:ElaB/YqjD/DUF883 family membrane-anchored ribosome-binding protein